MVKRCKGLDLTDWKLLYPWVFDCVCRHYRRYDFKKLLISHGLSHAGYSLYCNTYDKELFKPAVENIAKTAAQCIYEGYLDLKPIRRSMRFDGSTRKEREIGSEDAMQQVFDSIAHFASEPILKALIPFHQMSSIAGRGQLMGVRIIQSWVKNDNAMLEYAHRHNYSRHSNMAYHVKLDIRKCFPSANVDVFIRLFSRFCGNNDLIWLWRTLLESHKTETYHGFLIGSLVSQDAMQFMLGFAYRELMNMKEKKGHRGEKPKQLVSHCEFFMDDILITGGNRKHLKMAVKHIIKYIKDGLELDIKPNWQICALKDAPIDMMGYIVYRSGKVALRPRNWVKLRRLALRSKRKDGHLSLRQCKRFVAYNGLYKYTNSVKINREYRLEAINLRSRAIISRDQKRKNAKE